MRIVISKDRKPKAYDAEMVIFATRLPNKRIRIETVVDSELSEHQRVSNLVYLAHNSLERLAVGDEDPEDYD